MTFPQQYKSELLKAIDTIELDKVNQAIELFREARANGRHIFVCGNGGSASTASHFACDIVKGASFNRPSRFRIMALTDQLPTLTAYANDVSYDSVFVEQLRNFAEPGDLFMGISGSGNSPNVLKAISFAGQKNLVTIGLTGGTGGNLRDVVDHCICVPSDQTPRIQEAHILTGHILCELIDDELFPAK